MGNRTATTLAWVVALAFAASASAVELNIDSGEKQVGLLELYTSEGCSSCPPADRWLSALTQHEELWTRFVPVGLHVDYWDYIGWKDRFASPGYSRRQRDYARHNRVSTVYTPGFVYNGREWRSWFGRSARRFPDGGRPGRLRLSLSDDSVTLRFEPLSARGRNFDAHLALLGFRLQTDVRAGENDGRRLNHDFVVLGLREAKLKPDGEAHTAMLRLPAVGVEAPHYALAAWVSADGQPAPLQAVGGWLPDGI